MGGCDPIPVRVLLGPDRQALDGLGAFVKDMSAGRLRVWTSFIPTYVKLTLGPDGGVRDVTLRDFTSPLEL